MGDVYRARDTRLDRIVAIKVLPPALAADPQFRERFDREARVISSLSHPNICPLFDVGEAPGPESIPSDLQPSVSLRFLVMEYLDGETLAARIEKGPLKIEDALQIAIQVSSALDAAHRAGVVHRDLKPGNVMLTKTGAARQGSPQAKLLDFGLAKTGAALAGRAGGLGVVQAFRPAVAGGPAGLHYNPTEAPTISAPLTEQGTILGTFQYMAPEQIEGVEADTRTDIFAFGAMLFEMLTGKRAFEGKTRASLLGAILKDEPPPASQIQPVVPAALNRIVATCLEKDPDNRWQTARDLLRELTWIAESGSASASVASAVVPTGRTRHVWGVAGLLSGLLIGAVVIVFIVRTVERTRPSLHVTRVLVGVTPADQLQDQAGNEVRLTRTAIALSSDGRSLVFSALRG